jgi:hypothetical protein
MADRTALIEKAARALRDREFPDGDWGDHEAESIEAYALEAETVLAAVCPGLLDGSEWLAPVEMTMEMMAAAVVRDWDLVEPQLYELDPARNRALIAAALRSYADERLEAAAERVTWAENYEDAVDLIRSLKSSATSSPR